MLNEQLQKRIRSEATSSAANFHYYPGSEQFEDMETAYETGAFKYAEKWQEAQQLIERYEKALKDIKAKATFPKTENESGVTIYNILKVCNEALTPKTGSDE